MNPEDADIFIERNIPSRDYLIEPLIARKDFIIFSGPQKRGKSLLSLNLAISLARGIPWYGFKVTDQYRVGVVQQEIPENSLKERFLKMLKECPNQTFLKRIVLWNRPGIKLDDPVGRTRLEDWMKVAKMDMLVVDPLYHFHKGKENNMEDMTRVCVVLQNIAVNFDCAVLLIHHHGKPGLVERAGGDLHRGASVLRDLPDANWTFTTVTKKMEFEDRIQTYSKLSFELRHAESPSPVYLHINPETLWLEVIDMKGRRKKNV